MKPDTGVNVYDGRDGMTLCFLLDAETRGSVMIMQIVGNMGMADEDGEIPKHRSNKNVDGECQGCHEWKQTSE